MKKQKTGTIDMFDIIELFDDLERIVEKLKSKGYDISIDEDGKEWLRESWKTFYEYFPTSRKYLPTLYPTGNGNIFCEWNIDDVWKVNVQFDLLKRCAVMYAEHLNATYDTFTNKFDFNSKEEKEWRHFGFELNNFVQQS